MVIAGGSLPERQRLPVLWMFFLEHADAKAGSVHAAMAVVTCGCEETVFRTSWILSQGYTGVLGRT